MVAMPRSRRRERRHEVYEALQVHLQTPVGTAYIPARDHHPADIADVMWLDFEPEQAYRIFHEMPVESASEVLAESEEKLQAKLLEHTEPERIGALLHELPADDATDILEHLPEQLRLEAMCFIKPEDAADIRHLSEYPPHSAGGLMTTEIMTAEPEENVGDVLKRIKRDEGTAESVYTTFVVDDLGRLVGVVSARELLESSIHDTVGDIMIPDVIAAKVDEDQEDVAHRLLHYNLTMIPVLDPRGIIVGVVTADDALEVLEEEGSEDALLLAGASAASDAGEPLLAKVAHRAPMLLLPIIAGLAISSVIAAFGIQSAAPVPAEEGARLTLGHIVSFVPLALAIAGTIGMQTSAVLVRGFAVGQIVHGRRMGVFLGEVKVGLLLGALIALVAGPAMALFIGDLAAGMGMGFALMLAACVAATTASSIAMGSEAIGLDPALVAGPVMMAISDLAGTALFLGIASLMLLP
jgi:magnesium transporter